MTLVPVVHLSEDDFNDVLIGMSSTDAESHVAACELCRAQLAHFRSEMQLFDDAGLAWVKAKPAKKLILPAPWRMREAILAPVGWAMAAVVLITIAFPNWKHDRSAQLPQTLIGSEYGNSEVQIAQDNDLLRSVDMALNANETSIHQYGLTANSSGYRRLTAASIER